MSNRLAYVSARGERIALDGSGAFVGTSPAMRGRCWSYELGHRGVFNQSRPARTVSIDVSFISLDMADALRRAADRDVHDGTPGSFEIDGRWSQRAYVLEFEPDVIYRGLVTGSLSIALLDGAWRRPHVIELRPGGAASDGKGHPYAYPYSYGLAEGVGRIVSVGSMPGPVSITVYGPATDPSVTIGGNRFAVKCSVPSGGHLVIDGISLTVELVNAYGQRENRLADAVRGSGRGGGEYIFEEVGGDGEVLVSWPGTFGADVTWWEQEGEPPWVPDNREAVARWTSL